MSAVISTPTDVVNLALAAIGFSGRIGNLYDGSAAAKKALDLYAQTRDEVLRSFDWGFAEKFATAGLTGQPPPAPWTVEYAYPADCLRLRNLFNTVYLADQNDPLPNLYTIGNNGLGAKVIWAKTTGAAALVYTSQITDPTKWEPLFVETLVAALGKRLGPALKDIKPDLAVGEKETAAMAEGIIG